ncbi:MAG: SpoIIE family protein phosphatase [Anaerolineae bacterium]|nr:SpoIIE family protein phosphatase [Anaerolineae bacterium]
MNRPVETRIAVVSDQAIFLRGLTALAMSIPQVRLVGEGRNETDAVQLCQMTKPDMILVDLRNILDLAGGIMRAISDACPLVKVILFLSLEEQAQAQDVLDELSVYWFSREMSEEEFKAALFQVHQDCTREQTGFSHRREDTETEEYVFARPQRKTLFSAEEEQISHELMMAGKIQADILPEQVPLIDGWDVAARLLPARETSGDFYDFIQLTDRKWGIVMADVTDKGMGAAIFMALSSTLLRTYASRFPTLPAFTLNTVSERILSDTRGGMFVTMFFGVLEPHTGRLVYANAGHPPAYLVSGRPGKESYERLRPTGMALGVSETAQWKQKVIRLNLGDYLILYTDGITETQNARGDFFGEERLVDSAFTHIGCSAAEMLDILLAEAQRFSSGSHRQDDIALIVIRREQ